MYGSGHPECPSGYDRMRSTEDPLMVEGFGALPVASGLQEPVILESRKPYNANDNVPFGRTVPVGHVDKPVGWTDGGLRIEPVPVATQPARTTYRNPRSVGFDDWPRPSSSDNGRPGDFMQTATGRKFWPMDPEPDEVYIEDIAHSLSLQCRYAGHCLRFYSVAEHSVLIARHLAASHAPEVALWGLLHDASEAYLVDVPRPVKPYLAGYKVAEAAVMEAVCLRFGLSPFEMPPEVHEADSRIIADELVNLVPMDWHARHDDPLGVKLRFWSPEKAREEFLATFEALSGRQDRRAAA